MRLRTASRKEQTIRTLTDEYRLKTLSPQALSDVLRLALADASAATAKKILELLNKALHPALSKKEALLREYKVDVVRENQVYVALNGKPRIEILRAMNEVATELYGQPAIHGPTLELWANDETFTAITRASQQIGVDGNVKHSTNKARAEQVARGWNNVDLCDLALAHTAYFLATGESWGKTRARYGSVNFIVGLGLYGGVYSCDDDAERYVWASAALPSLN